ncbi:MAG: hypothetical protein SGJ02_02865 [bacterium]|nr:hypothetical protein [bacterium]
MKEINLTLGVLFGLAGLSALVFLLKPVLMALLPLFSSRTSNLNPKTFQEQRKINKYQKSIDELDAIIAQGDFSKALDDFQEAFILDHVSGKRSLIDVVKAHNLSLLERLLVLSEKMSQKFVTLPDLESLVLDRGRLLDLYFDSSLLRDKIKEKHKREGKSDNSKNNEEYEMKIDELGRDIELNAQSIRDEIRIIIVAARRSKGSPVNYH